MTKKNIQINLLDLIPIHNIKWETNEKNLVVLLKPKFTNHFLAKHLLPRLKNPTYKVNLDDFGTFVWNCIDGKKTVAKIGDELKKQFGEKVEPVYERLGMFIRTLRQNKFIEYR